MPIRFRCPHCSRLLGIARRKAGTQVNCPQCGRPVAVPNPPDLDDLDDLLHPPAPTHAAAGSSPPPLPPSPTPAPHPRRDAAPSPAGPAVAPKAATPKPKTRPPRPRTPGDDPLFENDDFDAMLGLSPTGPVFDLDDDPKGGPKPVSGLDVNSLDDEPGRLHFSPQKATILAVAVVVLLGVAFAAGFLIASRL